MGVYGEISGDDGRARNPRSFRIFGAVGSIHQVLPGGWQRVVVDMAVLALLADPKFLALNVTLGKILAAETAPSDGRGWCNAG